MKAMNGQDGCNEKDTSQKTFIELSNSWLQAIALILAGIWAVYTFGYKEIWIPMTAPITISSKINLNVVGEKIIDGKKFKAVNAIFEITNKSKRQAIFLQSIYVVKGRKVLNYATNIKYIDKLNMDLAKDGNHDDKNSYKYIQLSNNNIIEAGQIYTDWSLYPDETSQRSVLIYVPVDKYDEISVRVSYPIVNKYGVAAVKWVLTDNSYIEQIYSIQKNGKTQEVKNGEVSRFTKEIDYGIIEEYQSLSLWEKSTDGRL